MTQTFFLMAMLLPPVAVAFFVVKEWKRAVLAAAIVLFGAVWWEAQGISLHRYFARTVHSSMETGRSKDHATLQRMFRDARAGDRIKEIELGMADLLNEGAWTIGSQASSKQCVF